MDSDQWFDLNQVVKYDPENRTKATWYALVAKGEVPYYKKSKKLAFLKSEIDEFLKSGRRKSASESRNAPEEFLKQPKSRKG
jgi:predicted DNA-binding transcriptional regulator AlpA